MYFSSLYADKVSIIAWAVCVCVWICSRLSVSSLRQAIVMCKNRLSNTVLPCSFCNCVMAHAGKSLPNPKLQIILILAGGNSYQLLQLFSYSYTYKMSSVIFLSISDLLSIPYESLVPLLEKLFSKRFLPFCERSWNFKQNFIRQVRQILGHNDFLFIKWMSVIEFLPEVLCPR